MFDDIKYCKKLNNGAMLKHWAFSCSVRPKKPNIHP